MKNVYTEMLLSSPPRFIRLSSLSLILIGCQGNIKFRKIFKSLLRNHKEYEAEIRHTCLGHYPVQKVCFLMSLSSCFSCYVNLEVYIDFTYNGKSGNGQFLVSQISFNIDANSVVLHVTCGFCRNRLIWLVARVTYRVNCKF